MKSSIIFPRDLSLKVAACVLAMASPSLCAESPRKRTDSAAPQRRALVRQYEGHVDFRHHILAIDERGSAMEMRYQAIEGGARHRVVLKPFESEDTARYLSEGDRSFYETVKLECNGRVCRVLPGDKPAWGLFRWEFMRHLHGRKNEPDNYSRDYGLARPDRDGIFANYQRLRAAGLVDHIVIYIHGGMNFIGSAGVKACELTRPMLSDRAYPIFIIWNSNLVSTYTEHLWAVREGKRHPFYASATVPLQLFADVGTALARAPLSLIKLGRNDGYHLFPERSPRFRLSLDRYSALREAYLADPADATRDEIAVSAGAVTPDTGSEESFHAAYDTDKTLAMRAGSLASYLTWLPVKVGTTPLIDSLGTSAWFNMIRRTRVMFERESSFVRPELSRRVAENLEGKKAARNLQTQRDLRSLCREGALRIFCDAAEEQLATPAKKFPPVILIGHSMGCIVAGEILVRFPKFPVTDLVFMAAASTVNDFKLKVAPFLGGNPETHFYNLCLRTSAETGEREPWDNVEPAPRGSLLVWIDSLFDAPIAEDDRTIGRWDNALLAMDWLPRDAARRTTIKGFGEDRRFPPLSDTGVVPFPYDVNPTPPVIVGDPVAAKQHGSKMKWLAEPQKHGEFSHFQPGKFCYPFWRPYFWHAESIPEEMYPATTSKSVPKARRPQSPKQGAPRTWGR